MRRRAISRTMRVRRWRHRNTDTVARQVTFFTGRTQEIKREVNATNRMIEKIAGERGWEIYSHRMGIVEPVFGNIRSTKRLSRFSVRGRRKVNTQWLLFCMMHNIGKIQRYGTQQICLSTNPLVQMLGLTRRLSRAGGAWCFYPVPVVAGSPPSLDNVR